MITLLLFGQEVRRGKVGSPKKECGSRGMQQHVEMIHKDSAAGLQEACERKYDPKGGGNNKDRVTNNTK